MYKRQPYRLFLVNTKARLRLRDHLGSLGALSIWRARRLWVNTVNKWHEQYKQYIIKPNTHIAHCDLVKHYCTSTVVAELLTEPASVVENDPGVVETALFNGTFSFQYGH